jgi:hypothetical protein
MAIRDAVQALGIEVRAGLHTGECEQRHQRHQRDRRAYWRARECPGGAVRRAGV